MELDYGKLNDMQREAVLHKDGPLLILAGAGSGKTTVLIDRVARLIESGVRPWNILAITFTNKAAGELRDRLAAKLGPEAAEVFASTFHSMCVRILRRDADKIGLSRSFTIYDQDDSLRVVKKCLRELNYDEKRFPPKGLLSDISHAKEKLCGPDAVRSEAQVSSDFRKKIVAEVYAAYEKELRTAEALDFDALLTETVRLFRQSPETLEYYRDRWRYIMVDEYQDTNHVQYELVSLLAAKYRNLCVVGDDDQSIYKFRGATIENILSFENSFPGAKVIRLEQNYRSTQYILDAANSVIANNRGRKGKTLWTAKTGGAKVTVRRCENEEAEARFAADTILDHAARGGRYGDFAVLYRMHAQSNAFEKAFISASVPYKIIGGLRFYDRKEIKDLMAYLSLVSNRADNLRLERILNEPKRGIGDATLGAAREIAGQTGLPLFDIFEHADEYAALGRKASVLKEFTNLISGFAADAEKMDLDELFDEVCEKTGYAAMLKAMGDEGEPKRENLGELKTNILKYMDAAEEPSLGGFLEETALLTDIDRLEEGDAVLMMTVHSAKGLEFPQVFAVGMEESIFPGMQAIYEPEEMEEERRLAYVAMTRAKERLYLTAAASRMLFGQTTRNRLSRFVAEIADGLTEFTDEAARREPVRQSYHFGDEDASGHIRTDVTFTPYREEKAAPAESWRVGDRVRHRVFGEGTITGVTAMSGDFLLEIAFDTAGTKKLMANFARLRTL
ncbi:MAG TPA: UvrD-helicase domain-containing protein [Oscillospiraceae bacterium]|nr:UvrD-helicase domain-containing protein [Oscillospiraceae bacterium]HPV99458.1 UvrD-helicase domain-containing protein [Oscillospiraceae bacterium]